MAQLAERIASTGCSTTVSPCFDRSTILSRDRLYIATECPVAFRRSAIGRPMSPAPKNAILMSNPPACFVLHYSTHQDTSRNQWLLISFFSAGLWQFHPFVGTLDGLVFRIQR